MAERKKGARQPALLTFVQNEGKRCYWCGAPLPRSRSDRRFDTDVCRMAFTRWRQNLYNLTSRVMRDIRSISEYAPFVQICDPRDQINAISSHLERYRSITERRVEKAIKEFETNEEA